VQKALNELMAAVEANGEADARALSLLDYRNYHRYDIKMRPCRTYKLARKFRLAVVERACPGVRTKLRFFISMLAAFLRVYDLGWRTFSASRVGSHG
jgi:hypothetical protein